MWQYQKTLQYPVKIKNANPKLASFIISQYGGADGKCLSKNHFQNTHFIVFPSFPPLTISLKIVLAILFFS
ncbi:MAG: manganese catalase family protein, partial [Clostridia bacterium]|nr:manganese catalase family protein [Clostridia bacterium]